jgi:hypothetical protein
LHIHEARMHRRQCWRHAACGNVCPWCKKAFASRSAAQAHCGRMKGPHVQGRRTSQKFDMIVPQNRCPLCGQVFPILDELFGHVCVHREFALRELEPPIHHEGGAGQSGEVSLKCRFCDFYSRDRHVLFRHEVRHPMFRTMLR